MSFNYHILVQYYPVLLKGLGVTFLSLCLSLIIAIGIGLLTCLGNLVGNGLVYRLSRSYVDLFRVVPDVVLIFWIYYCLPQLFDVRMSAIACGILALSLGTGAFLSEVFRAGVLAIPRGQIEAAMGLSLSRYSIWIKIILPQAVRRMVPAFMNAIVDLLKHTSLLSGIGVAELTYEAYTLGAQTYRYLEFLSMIAVAYFALTFPLSLIARRLETRMALRTAQ